MGETIQQFKNQLNEYWQSIDKDKKKKIIIIGIITLLSIMILTFIFTRTHYEVLYKDLSLEDVSQITGVLDEMGVKWKTPKDDPTTILVPSELKDKIKIQLASEGLPKNGYSFLDVFNESSWSMTDYDKRERMKYALQNELASTISQIEGVKKATVYINFGDDSGFVLDDNQKETTASVFIEKSSNRSLDSKAVIAIQHLVASSVNMDPEKVDIIDDDGNHLTGNTSGSDLLLTDQLAIKTNLENKINNSLRKFLENIFGPGNVDVRSSVSINFDSEKTTSVEFSPPIEGSDEGLIRSIEEVEEHITGGAARGVPGQEENIPDDVITEDNQESYSRSSSTINYELNQINREISKAPGQVEDITVAILINRNVLVDGVLTQATQRDIENLIYAATGLNTRQVEVMAANFESVVGETPIADSIFERLRDLNWPVWLAALVGILATGGYMIRRRRKRILDQIGDSQYQEDEETKIRAEVQDLEFETGESEMKEKIDRFVDKNPEAVAQLLRTWLNE